MTDAPAGSDPDPEPTATELEALLARQYVERLEALDAEAERLLESIAKSGADPFDGQTRARAARHLREIRAQIHPLLIALRYRAGADGADRDVDECADRDVDECADADRADADRDGDRDRFPQDSI